MLFTRLPTPCTLKPKTLEEILNELYQPGEELFKKHLPTIVMDRGIATMMAKEILVGKLT
jgi:hypothetical protein